MKCTSIVIKGLFNTFDYTLSWNDESGNILLLTGPNGYGKTTILKILYYLKQCQLYFFYRLPFAQISIDFDNKSKVSINDISSDIEVHVKNDDVVVDASRVLRFQLRNADDKINAEFTFTEQDASIIERSYPKRNISHVGYSNEDKITSQEILNYIEQNESAYDFLDDRPGFGTIRMFLEALNVFYIPANRLFTTKNGSNNLSVKLISTQIRDRLRRENYKYLSHVSDMRSHVFENLIEGTKEYTREEYEHETNSLIERVVTLHTWGLIPFKEFIPYQDGKGAIFYVYLNEIRNTLAQYDDLYRKLEVFSSLLKRKHFINKTIDYSPSRGLIVSSSSGKPIDIDCLSSGEQNEIIMLYNFTFQLSSNMILLIDEPENSLHVEWQSVFYTDLEEICSANSIQVIVATHSPQIIGERWESCYDLFEQIEQQDNG